MQKISLNNKEDGVLSRYQKGSGKLKSLIESGFVVVVSEQYFKSNYNVQNQSCHFIKIHGNIFILLIGYMILTTIFL